MGREQAHTVFASHAKATKEELLAHPDQYNTLLDRLDKDESFVLNIIEMTEVLEHPEERAVTAPFQIEKLSDEIHDELASYPKLAEAREYKPAPIR